MLFGAWVPNLLGRFGKSRENICVTLKKQIKLSQYLVKHYALKTYRGVDV
jgi:hypothetical protein